ncbi:protein asteroid-like [Augochlora pura]
MGVRGLMSFMNTYGNSCHENHELQDTYLVIDGSNVSYQIYYRCAVLTCIFGGNYDVYEEAVSKFFDNLLECNVTPLVLLDGAYNISKIDTVLDRSKQRLENVMTLIRNPTEDNVPPLLMTVVFVQVLRKKNIRHARCMFEADGPIASLAKLLNCPVLSFDSDFYIHGTLYIPFDRLGDDVVKTPSGKAIRCQLYRYEHFLRIFKGLTHHTLSLAATILRKDTTIKPALLKNFFSKFEEHARGRCQIIYQTFTLLSQFTVDEAIAEILIGIPKSMRHRVLDAIESHINDYTCINLPEEVLVPLIIAKFPEDSTTPAYKFTKDIDSLPFRGKYSEEDLGTIDKNNMIVIRNILLEHTKSQNGNDLIIDRLPRWFVDEVAKAELSTALISYILKHTSVLPIQIENLDRPSSSLTSLKIVSVTYGLLSSLIDDRRTYMKYVFRDQNMNFVCNALEGTQTVPLLILRDLPLGTRREILNDVLGIKNMKCVDELLPEWKLYIGCIKYWTDQEKLYKSHKCYVYSIIICILYNIVISRVGNHRFIHSFQDAYGSLIPLSRNRRQACRNKFKISTDITIVKARSEINMKDCLLTLPFFIQHSNVQLGKIFEIDMSIVHAFAEFQMSLLAAIDLNALLGRPYREPNVANLFNGTFLYNVCKYLQTSNDVDECVNDIFENAPTFLRLFNLLFSKINPFLA